MANIEWFNIVDIVAAIIASVFIVMMFTPQFLMIYKTKNTVALSKPMFMLHMAVGWFYGVGGFCVVMSTFTGSDIDYGTAVKMIVLTALNVYVLALSCYMIYIKMSNIEASKQLKISELDHFKKYIENKA